jgi:hypothetical protein
LHTFELFILLFFFKIFLLALFIFHIPFYSFLVVCQYHLMIIFSFLIFCFKLNFRMVEEVPWVATTADCWSDGNKKRYLGMTLHWLDPQTRVRRQAVLACCRLRHPAALVQTIQEIHEKFQLQGKVSRVTTDNAGNFSQAFVQFTSVLELQPAGRGEPTAASAPDLWQLTDEDPSEEESSIKERPEFISVEQMLEEAVGDMQPAAHLRCAAHTLNMVATLDAEKALQNSGFKTAWKLAMTKAQALWSDQSGGSVMMEELGQRLAPPNTTSWISTCEALAALNTVLAKQREESHTFWPFLKFRRYCRQYSGFASPIICPDLNPQQCSLIRIRT